MVPDTAAWTALRSTWLAAFRDMAPAQAERRVDDYYLPIASFCFDATVGATRRPAMIGLSAPQGAGKSTLAAHIVEALVALGKRAVTISIDDFYVSHDAQRALALAHPHNPYLEYRGYPGTHDIDLGVATLDALRGADEGEVIALPAYDKSAHAGRGDRAARERWPTAVGRLDAVVLEGWMLGFSPVADSTIDDAMLRAPNAFLRRYDAWTQRLDAFVHLALADIDDVVAFRIDAERARRAAGAPGLSDDEARDYILRFLPAYRLWGPGLLASAPVSGPTMRIALGADRLPR